MSARGDVTRALVRLLDRPGWTLAALSCGAAAALALEAATHGAGVAFGHGHAGAGLFLFVLGGSISVLLFGAGLSVALSGSPRSGAFDAETPDVLRHSLRRGTAAVSLMALERVLAVFLLLAALAPFVRFVALQQGGAPARLSLAFALSAGLPLVVLMVSVPAFRVAVAEAAAGEEAWVALAHGLRLAFVAFPVLVRTLALSVLAAAPLWLLAAASAATVSTVHRDSAGWTVYLVLLRGCVGMLASAWIYESMLETTAGLSPIAGAEATP